VKGQRISPEDINTPSHNKADIARLRPSFPPSALVPRTSGQDGAASSDKNRKQQKEKTRQFMQSGQARLVP